MATLKQILLNEELSDEQIDRLIVEGMGYSDDEIDAGENTYVPIVQLTYEELFRRANLSSHKRSMKDLEERRELYRSLGLESCLNTSLKDLRKKISELTPTEDQVQEVNIETKPILVLESPTSKLALALVRAVAEGRARTRK